MFRLIPSGGQWWAVFSQPSPAARVNHAYWPMRFPAECTRACARGRAIGSRGVHGGLESTTGSLLAS
eukprot:7298357-Lingulodinium_polyedra.AAC.1